MLFSFFVTAVLIELTPGPNMTWLAVLGARRGRAPALSAVAGICLGLSIAAVLAGIGLTALLEQWPMLFTGLRWAGTLYLFYLAWDAWTDADGANVIAEENSRQAFRQGLVTNILNPKAYLFYAAMLPQFISGITHIAFEIALLSVIYVCVATVIHGGIALLAGSAAGFLQNSPHAVLIRKAFAVLIALAAAWFFYSTRITQ